MRKYLMKLLHTFSIIEDQIVIISGEWGLIARLLMSTKGDKKLLQKARRYILALKAASDEEDDDTYEAVLHMDAEKISKQLEEASNIGHLERK